MLVNSLSTKLMKSYAVIDHNPTKQLEPSDISFEVRNEVSDILDGIADKVVIREVLKKR